jgi:hypothetical protein
MSIAIPLLHLWAFDLFYDELKKKEVCELKDPMNFGSKPGKIIMFMFASKWLWWV